MVTFTGDNGEGLCWNVQSRTREDVQHEVTWVRSKHEWHCTCEDALYRKKYPNVDDPDWCLCWHQRQIKRLCRPILRTFGFCRDKED